MQNKSSYYQPGYDQNQQSNGDNLDQIYTKQRLRKQAYNRKTQYVHQPIQYFDHQQINSKQSQQLKKQLTSLYKPKVQLMRTKFDLQELQKDYQKNYQEFIKMTLKNQIQQRQLTQSITQMHQMADILINVPNLNQTNLYLYNKSQQHPSEQQQINKIFDIYQIAYKQGEQVEENIAQQTIKKAKQFLRDRYA